MKYILFLITMVSMIFSHPYDWRIKTDNCKEDTFVLYQYVISYATHFTADKDNDGWLEFYETNPIWSEPQYINIKEWRQYLDCAYATNNEHELRLTGDSLFIPIIIIEYRGRKFRMKIDLENQ